MAKKFPKSLEGKIFSPIFADVKFSTKAYLKLIY